MSKHVDLSILRGSETSHEIAGHLREAAKIIPQALLTNQLLEATEQEILAPDVFCVWLSANRSTSTIISGLKQSFSNLIRHNAILEFGKVLLTTQWKTAWTDVGGTPGIIRFLEGSSTDEVATFCTALGRTGKLGKGDVEPKRDKITELLKALLPQFYPESPYKTEDRRPLSASYAALVSSCTSEYVEQVLRNGGHPFPIYGCLPSSQLAQYHWPLLRKLVLELVEGRESALWLGVDAKKNFFNFHISYLLLHIPQLPSTEGGFSSPMAFSLSILRILASKTEDVDLGRRSVIYGIIDPLVRRMRRRTVDTKAVQEVIGLVLRYYGNHPNDCTQSNFTYTEFTSFIIRSWCKDPLIFETPLCTYFDLMQIDFLGTYPSLDNIVRVTAKKYRYRLLRLIMLHNRDSKVDINNEDGLTLRPNQLWPRELIQSLPSSDAVGLLRRLIRKNPHCEFLGTASRRPQSQTILAQVIEPGSSYPDPKLLITEMGYDHDEIISEGREKIENHKEKAVRSRDHEGRAFFTNSAAFYAIATRSLDTYEDVILWSKRFLRDPLTVRIIFNQDALCTREGLSLLSGIPKGFKNLNGDGVRDMVLKGNRIIMHLFEMAVTALKEQSFAVRDWRGVLSLFAKVVVKRIQQSWRLKTALRVGSSEIYHILWESTLEMLLKAETIGLEPGHEALEFDSPFGSINRQLLKSSQLQKVCASTHTFLDKLAAGRDHIWQTARPTWYPAAAVLDWPWPRGLPIQCYCHLRDLTEESSSDQYPFISSRVRAVLFLERNPIIKAPYPDEEVRQAIGSYIDSYEAALDFYTLGHTNKADQAKAASATLAHAINLCCDRMTRLEALRYLSSTFRSKNLDKICKDFDEIKEEQDKYQFPIIPDIYDPLDRTEWNPLDGKPNAVTAKRFTPTVLDYMLTMKAIWFARKQGYFPVLKPTTSGVNYSDFWSSSRLQKIGAKNFAVQDASIASALLFLDARLPGPPQMLVSPYPTAQSFRLPSLFLDQEFLDVTRDDHEPVALSVLELFLRRVPSRLLQLLTKGALKDLAATPKDSPDISTRQSVAFRLLQLLARSDHPGLACDDILDTVLNTPDASSWHRFLLTKTFLQRLPNPSAKAILEAFVRGIQQKLQYTKQARRQTAAQKSSPGGKSEGPVIKLTTIKFVAQLFEDTTVVPVAESTSMLATLFRGAGSLDVRLAVVNGLLSRLFEYKDDISNPLAEQILTTLELAIPVIGSLSERQVLREKDWIESEQTGQLPEVYEDGSMKTRPPILDAVYQAYISPSHLRHGNHLALFNRILLPAVELSKANNERWMKLFLKKHCSESYSHSFPVFPVRPHIALDLLLHDIPGTPVKLLEYHQLFVLTNILRPSPIDRLVESCKNDSSFRSSNAGKHFLNMYDNSDIATSAHRLPFGELLQKNWRESRLPDGTGILLTHLQACFLAQSQALLMRPVRSATPFADWHSFVETLALRTLRQDTKVEDVEIWINQARPLLENVIEFVDAMRENRPLFQSHRLPSSISSSPAPLTLSDNPYLAPPHPSPFLTIPHLLPDLSFLHFWAASPCPQLLLRASLDGERHRFRTAYACQIVTLVRSLLQSGKPSQAWLPQLQLQLQQWRGRDTDRWPMIELLGTVQQRSDRSSPPGAERKEEEEKEEEGSATTLSVQSEAERVVRVTLADALLEDALADVDVDVKVDADAVGIADAESAEPPTRLVLSWLDSSNAEVRAIGWRRALAAQLTARLPAVAPSVLGWGVVVDRTRGK